MRSTNTKTTEALKEEKAQYAPSGEKTRILLVNGHPAVREKLMQVINKRPDLGVCIQAEDADEALMVIEKQEVDFTILDISLEGSNSPKIAEKIKLHCPGLPILILSMHDEAIYVESTAKSGTRRCAVKREATDQIVKAIRYVQSMVKSQLSGFTVLVKL